MSNFNTEGLLGPTWYYNDDYYSDDIPVDGGASTLSVIASRIVVPCRTGDKMRVSGEIRVTNDIGPNRYVVGIGLRLAWYRYEAGPTPLTWFSKATGTNVDRSIIHHAAIGMDRYWEAPPDWPEGHRVVFRLYVDAHSTAWEDNDGDDTITIDNYGHIDVMRWTSPVSGSAGLGGEGVLECSAVSTP